MSVDDRDELLALGAAGALGPQEESELESLLASDPAAAARFSELLDDVTTLADSVAAPPPPRLRAAVLAAIAESAAAGTGGDAPIPERDPGLPPPAAPDTQRDTDDDTTPTHIAPVIPIHRRRWLVGALSVAAAIVLVVGALVVTRDADAPTDMAAAVLADDDAESIELTGDLGTLRFVRSVDNDASVLVGDGIAAPSADRVLQLWALDEGEDPVGMGTFTPDDDGRVELVLEGDDDVPAAQYAITVEPEGGSETPTMPIVAIS